jgi:hypothetical protein
VFNSVKSSGRWLSLIKGSQSEHQFKVGHAVKSHIAAFIARTVDALD